MNETGDRRPPDWWCQLQGDFGNMLRTPLREVDGRFEPDPQAGSPALLDALTPPERSDATKQLDVHARLRVYQSQYWMRLFNTMQTAFPRLTRVVGPWRFNHLAQLHLLDRPPAHADLDRCADGFQRRLMQALALLAPAETAGSYAVDTTPLSAASLSEQAHEDPYCRQLQPVRAPRTQVRQALSMDEAQRRAMLAGSFKRWDPPSLDLEQLTEQRLRLAPSLGLVREDWDLAPLGFESGDITRSGDIERHPAPRYWVFFRGPNSVGSRRIHPVFARLLMRAARQPLGRALAATRRACRPEQAQLLDDRLEQWLASAADAGWWIGLQPP